MLAVGFVLSSQRVRMIPLEFELFFKATKNKDPDDNGKFRTFSKRRTKQTKMRRQRVESNDERHCRGNQKKTETSRR